MICLHLKLNKKIFFVCLILSIIGSVIFLGISYGSAARQPIINNADDNVATIQSLSLLNGIIWMLGILWSCISPLKSNHDALASEDKTSRPVPRVVREGVVREAEDESTLQNNNQLPVAPITIVVQKPPVLPGQIRTNSPIHVGARAAALSNPTNQPPISAAKAEIKPVASYNP